MRQNSAEPLSFLDVASEGTTLPPRQRGPGRADGPTRHPAPEHGTPVTFAGTMGFLYPGTGPIAVLMLGPIGYEELCARTTWLSLAGLISAAGVPCLRFDYPGTADALDPAGEPAGLEDWREAAQAGADLLRAASGAARLIVVGQGLGGALAAAWARNLGALDGCVLMAPVSQGRRYLRELSIWTRLVTDRIGIAPDPDDPDGVAVAGFALAPGRIAAIRALDLARLEEAPARHALIVERPGHAGDDALATRLAALGAAVTRVDYAGHEAVTGDPTAAVPPTATLRAVADWVAARAASHPSLHAVVTRPEGACRPLTDGVVSERPLRFGPGGRLFGVLCEPAGRPAASAVVLVNAGRDYHIGWGRVTVDQARALAARGVASLRFDAGGIGDSPAAEDGPAEVLYSQAQIDDVRAAVDLLDAAGFRDIALVGRCSGAHAAFNAAVADERVGRVVMVNIERFLWDPDENIADALRYAHRSLGDFGATLWKRDGLKRLLTGRLRVASAGRHLAYRYAKAASLRLAPVMGGLTRQGRFHREVHRRLAVLAGRGVEASLVFSEGDLGLAEFHRYFGRGGRRLARYPDLTFGLVAAADHNFTHRGARARLLATLLGILAP